MLRPLRLALTSLALLAAAAPVVRADDLALIDRPLTLPAGGLEATLLGGLTSWGGDTASGKSLTGEVVVLGADYGLSKDAQLGLALAFPINPNAGFGSALASFDYAVRKETALRLDIGYEREQLNLGGFGTTTNDVFFAGLGAPQSYRLSSMVSVVSGKTGAINFGHFSNFGSGDGGLYLGSSVFANNGSDLISVSSATQSQSGVDVVVNLPIGLMVQPDPHVSFTLRTGYSGVFEIPSQGSTQINQFIPVGLDVVVSPNKQLDLGASFALAGLVSANNNVSGGYADIRMATLWLRWRIG